MSEAIEREFDSLSVGEVASFEIVVSDDDVQTFASLSGDYNPLHTDDAYAKNTPFGQKVVHGMFLGALVSRLVGMQLPGKQALLMKESLEFKKPVHVGDIITVEGTIVLASPATRIVELDVQIRSGATLVAVGNVHVQVRDE